MNNAISDSVSIELISQQVRRILEEELSKNPGSNEPVRIDLTGINFKQK